MKDQLFVTTHKWELPIVLTALFLGALVVRCIAIFQTPVISSDSILYIKAARLYYTGNYHAALEVCQFSIFPLILSPFYKIVGDWAMTGQLVSTMCGALTVIPLYLLARRIFDDRVALFGAIFYITCPNLVRYSAEVLRDIPFVLFYVSALWLAYTGIKDEKGWYLGFAGIFIAISALIRREGMLLLIIVCLYLMWKVIRRRVSWKKATILLVSFLLPLICILSLLGIFSKEIHRLSPLLYKGIEGEVRVSFTGSTIETIEKDVDEKNFSSYGKNFFQLAKQYRLLTYLAHIIYKSIKVFTIPIFLLLLFGFIKRKKIEYRGDEFLLLSIWGVFIIVFLFHLNNTNYFSTRYPFPVVVPSLIWSGVGFVELKERAILWLKAKDSSLRDRVIRWVTPLLLFIICVPLLAMAWAPNRKNKLELKEIGVWLRDHGYAHSIIVGQYEFTRLAFYADGDFIELSQGSYQDTIRFAREKEGDLLVINKKTINHLSPGFLDKLSPKDLQRIDIPDIQTPKYATTVFLIKSEGKGQ